MAINFDHKTDTITATSSAGRLSGFKPPTSYTLFTSSGTWTKPTGVMVVYVECIGAGGGGGGGAYVDTSVNRTYQAFGGAGGNGGVRIAMLFPASTIASTVTVTVGTGGAGGGTINPYVTSAGAPGGTGGSSSFGSYIKTPQASGGNGGGANVAASGVSFIYYGNQTPLVDGLYSAGGGTSTQTGFRAAFGPSGGGGGGVAATAGATFGADGGRGFSEWFAFGDMGQSRVGGGFGSGGAPNDFDFGAGYTGAPGDGGGGGGGSYSTNNGAGGAGAAPGGGGGGAGGCTLSGAGFNTGGNGGDGQVLVVAW